MLPTPLERLTEVLEDQGYRLLTAATPERALELIRATRPDLLIVEVWMAGAVDWEVLDTVQLDLATAGMPVVVCSAAVDTVSQREPQLRAQGCGVLLKPFCLDELLAAVQSAIGPPVGLVA
jgi:putative two-component system response regulator